MTIVNNDRTFLKIVYILEVQKAGALVRAPEKFYYFFASFLADIFVKLRDRRIIFWKVLFVCLFNVGL